MLPKVEAAVACLASYRLQNNLTFQALSDQMAQRGHFVPARTLHLTLTGRVIPVDRTQFRITEFVTSLRLLDGVHSRQLPRQPRQTTRTRRRATA